MGSITYAPRTGKRRAARSPERRTSPPPLHTGAAVDQPIGLTPLEERCYNRVRPPCGDIAQLGRARRSQCRGWGFDSPYLHQMPLSPAFNGATSLLWLSWRGLRPLSWTGRDQAARSLCAGRICMTSLAGGAACGLVARHGPTDPPAFKSSQNPHALSRYLHNFLTRCRLAYGTSFAHGIRAAA